MVEFRILGPLEVTERGQPLTVSGQQRRLLLSAFLLYPNRPLTTQQLRSWLWADEPADVRNALHTALSKLRRSVKSSDPAAADILHTVRRPIHAHETGYQLAADTHQLDSLRFARLTADARTALAADRGDGNTRDRDLEHAAGALREALSLWRGDQVLQGLHLPEPLRSEADRLQRLRLDALQARIDTDLTLDRHTDLLTELDALVAAHPDHERFRAQLMLARYRSGQQVAALAAYQSAYRTLVDRYGVEPSPLLQRLQQQILARDPALDSPVQTSRRAGRPYDLPPPPPQLVGRDRAVHALDAMLTAAGPAPVVVIHGPAGAGKTAVAVATAHRLRARFPHGAILADLRGSTGRPAEPEELLGHILDALGAHRPAADAGLQALTLRMRTLLADRRVLLVLDDAAAEHQIRPLLPSTPASAVVITSRTPLHALPATGKLPLAPLGAEDAVTLLGVSIHPVHGAARVQAERDAAQEVARRCGHLPLALRIAGGKLAARPSWTLRTLAARLRDRGLDELRLGDLDLRAALDASTARLTAAQQRTLRLLALVDGLDVAPWTVTALLGDEPPAGDLLDELVDAHLLEYGDDGRYRLPEPLQQYAAEQLAHELPAGTREAARDRFLNACLEIAAAATASLPPAWLPHLAGVAAPRRARRPPVRVARTDPLGILTTERDVLHAAVRQAHATGRWALTWKLVQPLLAWCDATDRWDDWAPLGWLAVDAARQSGDAAAQAAALASLGWLLTARGQLPRATALLDQSLALASGNGDRQLEAAARVLRAETSLARGDPAALPDARAAVQLLRDQPFHDGSPKDQSPPVRTSALRVLGQALHRQGHLDEAESVLLAGAADADPTDRRGALAAACALAALRLDQDRGDEAARLLAGALRSADVLPAHATGHALTLLGDCRLAQERWKDAEHTYARAGELLERIGDEPGRVGLLARTGWLRHRLGDSSHGEALLRDALTLLRRLDRGHDHARTLHSLGLVYRDQGRHRQAATALQDAATQLTTQNARHLALLVLTDLGAVHLTLSQPMDAAAILTQASDLRTQLALPGPHPLP